MTFRTSPGLVGLSALRFCSTKYSKSQKVKMLVFINVKKYVCMCVLVWAQ